MQISAMVNSSWVLRMYNFLDDIFVKEEAGHKILVQCNEYEKLTANTIVNSDKVPMKASGREQGGLLISECLPPHQEMESQQCLLQ